MINIYVCDEYKALVDISHIQRVAQKTLSSIGLSPHEFTITIVIETDQTLRELNKEYLGHDETTDVLSFEINEKDMETGALYLGDIVISFQRAKEQALAAGHSVIGEIALLLIHGILHLAGHDHVVESDKKRMWSLQQRLLLDLDFDDVKVPD